MDSRSFEALLRSTDAKLVADAFEALMVDKKRIESQLAADAAAMLEERNRQIDRGKSPREAQMHATASRDQDWRRRAAAALRVIDTELPRLRRHLAQLNASASSSAGSTQIVEVVSGSPAEIAGRVRSIAATNRIVTAEAG